MAELEIPAQMLEQFEKIAFVASLTEDGYKAILSRFRLGAKDYGVMTFESDDRDLFQECAEEIEDALVYSAMILHKFPDLPSGAKRAIRDLVSHLGDAYRRVAEASFCQWQDV